MASRRPVSSLYPPTSPLHSTSGAGPDEQGLPPGFDMSAVTANLMNDPNLMAALAVRRAHDAFDAHTHDAHSLVPPSAVARSRPAPRHG